MFSGTALYLMLAPLVLQIIIFVVAVILDTYISKRHKKILFVIIVLITSLIVQNFLDYYFDIKCYPFLRTLVCIYGYSIRPIIIILFTYIVSKYPKEIKWSWVLVVVNALIYLTALFTDIVFYIDVENHFHGSFLRYTCHFVSIVFLVQLQYQTIKSNKNKKMSSMIITTLNEILIIIAIIFDIWIFRNVRDITFLTITVLSCSLSYYIWLHLNFVYEHENALKAEQRIQIMMSQIQPHFMYNTLSTIQALCKTDPDKAFKFTEKFGTYLRQNLSSLNQTDLIPVEKEIEHTKIYAEIEMTRFPSIIVNYELNDNDIVLPALTIQPLVENAIRHGVRVREQGIITVKTDKKRDYHEIIIEDNGKGFDKNVLIDIDNSHIGINNVKERIETMCKGTLFVESIIDKGTKITIHIPYKNEISGGKK